MKRAAVILATALCLFPASSALAAVEPVQALALSLFEPPKYMATHWSFEFGPVLSFPMPVASASREEPGLAPGFSFTAMTGNGPGLGFDVAYHYWPVSTAFKDRFNDLIRGELLNALELGGTTWRPRALQLTGHLKIAGRKGSRPRPWVQLGAGVYRVDPYTTGYRGDAGFFTVIAQPLRRANYLGGYATVGVDLLVGRHTLTGLEASAHFVDTDSGHFWNGLGSSLDVFEVGVHTSFDY